MVLGKNVLVLPVDEDRYGRIVGWVFIEEINLNKALIRAGLAWHYRQYSSDSLSTALEMEARVMKKGLWSEPDPVPPWEWRRKKKTGKTKFEFSGGISTTIEH
jgi:micrococcal nuclease